MSKATFVELRENLKSLKLSTIARGLEAYLSQTIILHQNGVGIF